MKLYQPIDFSEWEGLKNLNRKPWNECILIYGHRGGQSFFMVDPNGDLYGFGENKNGLLGNINQAFITHPIRIDISKVIALDSGNFHVVALLENGDLYTWGLNTFGQLGNRTLRSTNVPTKVDISEEITNICCGYFCSLALDENQDVWFWGCLNEVTPSTQSELEPVQIMCGKPVINIACGGRHAAILTTEKLYIWGSNEGGQLGKANIDVAYYYQSVLNLPNNLSDVVCGAGSTAVLTTDGKVFCWGYLAGTEKYNIVEASFRGKVFEISANGDEDIFYAILDNYDVFHWGYDVDIQFPKKLDMICKSDIYANKSKTPPVYCKRKLSKMSSVPFHQQSILTGTISEKMALLFNNKAYSNVKIKISGDEIIYAHKLILALNSLTFYHIFLDNTKSQKTIDLTKNDSVAIKCYIKFLYTDELEDVHINHLPELYNFAKRDKKRNIQKQISLKWINSLNEKNIVGMFKLAFYHQCKDLIKPCLPNMKKVIYDKFESLNLTAEILFQIIKLSEIFKK